MASKRGTLLAALVGVPLVAAALTVPAAAGLDHTPPKLHTPAKATFVVGSQISQQHARGVYFTWVPERIHWSATDDSGGPLRYTVWQHTGGAAPTILRDHIARTSVNLLATDEDGSWTGGSNLVNRWSVQAFDPAGNSTRKAVYGAKLVVTQEDNTTYSTNLVASVHVKTAGSWRTQSNASASAGATRQTNRAGDTATVSIDDRAAPAVHHVALIAQTGPDRGIAKIDIDGSAAGTVDLGSPETRNKVVVWRATLARGNHTITIVNLATPGRRTIDIDAVALN